MLFQDFYNTWFDQGCFTSNQIYAWRTGFDKNNLGRWVSKGLLIKLRNGYYTFPHYLNEPDFGIFVANRIYKPSYLSLQAALAFYGLIPEAILKYTSVSTLKTNEFNNLFGSFTYNKIKPECYFGYDVMPFSNGKSIRIAKTEKALLDLLYFFPFYNSEMEFIDLRLDESVLNETVNRDTLTAFAEKYKNKSLIKRLNTFLKVYMP